jgi:hypothetical protein
MRMMLVNLLLKTLEFPSRKAYRVSILKDFPKVRIMVPCFVFKIARQWLCTRATAIKEHLLGFVWKRIMNDF